MPGPVPPQSSPSHPLERVLSVPPCGTCHLQHRVWSLYARRQSGQTQSSLREREELLTDRAGQVTWAPSVPRLSMFFLTQGAPTALARSEAEPRQGRV